MSKLSDELLKKIAEGSGRCYPHEGKAMAQEIIEHRTRLKEAAAAAASLSGINGPGGLRLCP